MDVVVDDSGNIYTADRGNRRVQRKQISPEITICPGAL